MPRLRSIFDGLRALSLLALVFAIALVVSLFAPVTVAFAQVPNAQPPYNTIATTTLSLGSRFTTDGLVTGTTQTNVDKLGTICRNKQVSTSGTPSVYWGIQIYDAVQATWFTYAATTQTAAEGAIIVRDGAVVASAPAAAAVVGLPLPYQWRVFQQVFGTGAGSRSAISCSMVK